MVFGRLEHLVRLTNDSTLELDFVASVQTKKEV